MNKKKVTEIFNELLIRFYDSESECIQNYNCGEEGECSHDDLKKDIKLFTLSFENALKDNE